MPPFERLRRALHAFSAPDLPAAPSSPASSASVHPERASARGALFQAYDTKWFEKGLDPPWGQNRMMRPYAENPTIHRAVRVLADIVSAIPFELLVGDSDKPAPKDDAVVKSFTSPTETLSGTQLWSRTVMDLLLFGNAVWRFDGLARLSAGDARDFPRYFRPLPMSRTMPDFDPATGMLRGWKIQNRGRASTVSLEESVHFFVENPYDDVLGLPEIAAIAGDAQAFYAGMNSNLRLLKRGGPGIIIERSEQSAALMGPESDESLKATLDEEYQNEDEHTAAVLPPGMKAVKSGATQREMDFEKLLRLNRENIGGTLGVSPGLLGILEYANYANMESQLEYVYNFTAFPMTVRLEGTVQRQILDRFGIPYRAYFKREGVRALYQNLSKLSEVASKLWQMGVPFEVINDRLELGLDVKKYPWLADGFLPFSVTPASTLTEEPEEPAAPAPPPAKKEPEPAPEEEGLRKRRLAFQGERSRSARWQAYTRQTDKVERKALGDWRGFLQWMTNDVLGNLKRSEGAPPALVVQAIPRDLMPTAKEIQKAAVKFMERSVRLAAQAGRDAIIADLSADPDRLSEWDVLDPEVTKIFQERAIAIKIGGMNASERIHSDLVEGIEKGETIDQLADRVRARFREEYNGQARTVARTETLSAFSKARDSSMGQAGVEEHEWLSARDELVRELHQIDGETAKLGSEFSNGLRFPHDPEGEAGNVINCRCVTLPVVEPPEGGEE